MKQIHNPPNPYETHHREWLGNAPTVKLQIFEDDTRSILSRNESPDVSFRWSVNPYRGCFHACAYCYARPSHEYLGFGAGTDFESKLVVKRDAPMLLRQAFLKPSWKGEVVVFSGNTDCYQPLEAAWGLTRACLEVCAEFRNPVAIITKAALILRDMDVLRQLTDVATLTVNISVPFADNEMARNVEPQAPSITKRLLTIKTLADAGIRTAVSLAPVIPGLNDDQMMEILQSARQAGAQDAFYSLVRLSGSVEPVFLERMAAFYPDRIQKITHRLREVRGGMLN
ncbi:MAG: radical SAM protein, partial [Nitrospirae bacterium]